MDIVINYKLIPSISCTDWPITFKTFQDGSVHLNSLLISLRHMQSSLLGIESLSKCLYPSLWIPQTSTTIKQLVFLGERRWWFQSSQESCFAFETLWESIGSLTVEDKGSSTGWRGKGSFSQHVTQTLLLTPTATQDLMIFLYACIFTHLPILYFIASSKSIRFYFQLSPPPQNHHLSLLSKWGARLRSFTSPEASSLNDNCHHFPLRFLYLVIMGW